jgi:hypothetical protein
MIQSEAICDSRTAIVTDNGEPRESEMPHDFNNILRHRAFAIRSVVRGRWWTSASPVAAQVRTDDGEIAGKQRRDSAPH